ncbi:MAG TPA: AAA family ATPase [Methylomirabilota bacterium]|jgi:predicted kinase|nr:AAA family ATPase [Methylomirabilota bacterium]
MEAVIFIGIQGSGKSTFFRERFFDTHVRINLDMLRTRRREELLVAACLEGGQSFAVDNTNPQPSDRMRYVQPARAAGFRVVAYFFEASLREAMERNNLRAGKQKVPPPAVAAAFKKLIPPTADEGFDEIYTVKLTAERGFVVARNTLQD